MQFLKSNNIKRNDIALISEDGNELSYGDLVEGVKEISSFLVARKLAFVFCKNDIPSIAIYLAMINCKVVPMLLRQNIPTELLKNLIVKYRPQYIFVPNYYGIEALSLSYKCIYKKNDYSLFLNSAEIAYKIHDDLALLLTTSGSTGSPKFVSQSYQNIASNTASIIEYLKIDEKSRLITTLPMYYTYGLSMIQMHLSAGATIILNESTILEKDFWQLLKSQQATTFGGVPYTYEVLKKLRFERMNVPSIKLITQAGGRLEPALVAEFAKICEIKNIEFFVMYGATEATARMSYLPPKLARDHAGSIGIAIPRGKFSLKGENGEEIVRSETIGELIYHGDNVMMGYAENYHDLAHGDEQHGVLATGDMAKYDENGLVYIVGRKKRFLKLYGNRVNLVEVEEILHNHGYDCACTGKDDQMIIYLTNQYGKEDVCKFISCKLEINQIAFRSCHIDEIPRNESGKVLYEELGIRGQ